MSPYRHTQTAPLLWLSAPIWLTEAAVPMLVDLPLSADLIIWTSALILMLMSWNFSTWTIEDRGENLRAWFGRIDLLGVTVPYSQIISFAAEKTSFLDGWGMHYVRGGWLYNLWGLDCVRIDRTLSTGKQNLIRLGTDDVAGLIELLAEKQAKNAPAES